MSFASFDPSRVDQIVESLSAMLQRRSIARELQALKQVTVTPEHVDEIVLAAINVSLNLEDESLANEIPSLRIDNASVKPAKAA
jgi:hypothetical protein